MECGLILCIFIVFYVCIGKLVLEVRTWEDSHSTLYHLHHVICFHTLLTLQPHRFQADLEAQDIHSRTPLFIACAMNREVCAEYLIDCLDQAVSDLIIENVNNNALTNHGTSAESANNKNHTGGAENKTLVSVEDKMMHTDRRGDTPLHAAACNGAVECLLLLLQHGIDPRLKNLTGLKAIDLAVRNRHKKCKDILAEYHLHYCTSGDFDSVLFLAMLEVSVCFVNVCVRTVRGV